MDTEDLVLSSENKNYNETNLNKRPTIFKKSDNILNPPKRQYYNYNRNNNDQQLSSNYQRLMKSGVDVYQFTNINDEKQEQLKNLSFKRKNMLNREGRPIIRKNNNNNIRPYGGRNDKKDINNINTVNKFVLEKKEENKKKEKQNFSWFAYMKFIICCGRNNSKIQYYDDFRKQIISEENILQYHLDIYKLLKACNIEKNSPDPQNMPEKSE